MYDSVFEMPLKTLVPLIALTYLVFNYTIIIDVMFKEGFAMKNTLSPKNSFSTKQMLMFYLLGICVIALCLIMLVFFNRQKQEVPDALNISGTLNENEAEKLDTIKDEAPAGTILSPQPPQKIVIANPIIGPIEVGEIIEFGPYDWRVLEVGDDGTILVITDKIIDKICYNESNEPITWEDSYLREYLNNDLFNQFTANEQAQIIDSKLTTNDNPYFPIDGGNDTVDKIFLLSNEEVLQYFGDSGEFCNVANFWLDDEYNDARVATDLDGNIHWWLLRSPNAGGGASSFVHLNGHLYVHGGYLPTAPGGVRPAMRLDW